MTSIIRFVSWRSSWRSGWSCHKPCAALRPEFAPFIALAATSVASWSTSPLLYHLPAWFWQVVLVGLGIALAGASLLTEFRRHEAMDPPAPGRECPWRIEPWCFRSLRTA